MPTRFFPIAGLLLGLIVIPPGHAGVTVDFVDPLRYTDVGDHEPDRERYLRILERHLATLAGRCLRNDESLEIAVLDIDLAGRYEWWRRPSGIRVMDGVTWPRIGIEYIWRDRTGNVIAEGREQLSDTRYLRRSAQLRFRNDALSYEKALLRDWSERHFCRGR